MPTQTRKVDAKSRVILPDQFAGKVVIIDAVSEGEVRVRLSQRRPVRFSLGQMLKGAAKADFHPDLGDGPAAGAEEL